MLSSKNQKEAVATSTVMPLRKQAKAAWQCRLKDELEWQRRIMRQLFALLDRVYAICSHQYDVNLLVDGMQVRATVDGLHFISTYYEMYESIPIDSPETFFGLRLWWQCAKCKRIETSDVIYTDYDLGRQLEVFLPEASHNCQRQIRNRRSI
jgi:hypothetical protein